MTFTRILLLMTVAAVSQSIAARDLYVQRTHAALVAPELITVFDREARKTTHSSDLLSFSALALASRNYEDKTIGNYVGALKESVYDSFMCVDDTSKDGSHISSQSLLHSINFHDVDIDEDIFPAQGRAKVNFNPEQRTMLLGLHLRYRFLGGFESLYWAVSVPFVRVGQGIYLFDRVNEKFADLYRTPLVESLFTASIRDFLSGAYSNDSVENHQQALTKAKIDGRIHYKNGLSDIKVKIGNYFLESETTLGQAWAGVTLPLGNKPTGEFLFEPVTGNGGHTGLFSGASLNLIFWDTDTSQRVEGYLEGEINYHFPATEVRTLGFTSAPAGDRLLWDYYRLGAAQGGTVMFPMANVLTRPVLVSPGFGGNGALGVKFHSGILKSDVAYTFDVRSGETIGFPTWEDNKYALVADDYDASIPFDVSTDTYVARGASTATGYINKEHLVRNTAQAPQVIMHGVAFSVGLNLEDSRWSPALMAGVYYSFPSNNSAFTSYAVWLKGGISF